MNSTGYGAVFWGLPLSKSWNDGLGLKDLPICIDFDTVDGQNPAPESCSSWSLLVWNTVNNSIIMGQPDKQTIYQLKDACFQRVFSSSHLPCAQVRFLHEARTNSTKIGWCWNLSHNFRPPKLLYRVWLLCSLQTIFLLGMYNIVSWWPWFQVLWQISSRMSMCMEPFCTAARFV